MRLVEQWAVESRSSAVVGRRERLLRLGLALVAVMLSTPTRTPGGQPGPVVPEPWIQQELAGALAEAGAELSRDCTLPGSPVVAICLRRVGTPADLHRISRIETLRRLDFSRNWVGGRVSGEQVRALAQLRGLREINLNATPLGEEALAALGQISGLETLDLGWTGIRGPATVYLWGLQHLRELDLSGLAIRDDDLRGIVALRNLERLNLTDTDVRAEGARYLRGLPHLRELALPYLTPGIAEELKHLQALESLKLDKARGEELGLLSGMDCLKRLDLTQTGPIGAPQLRALEHLKGLRSLSLARSGALKDSALEALSHLSGLEELDLATCNGHYGDAGIRALKSLTRLQSLNIAGSAVTEEGLRTVASLPELRRLGLAYCIVSDSGFQILRGMGKLTQLDLCCTPVSTQAAGYLAGLRSLEELDLSGVDITDAGLGRLAQAERLRTLRLRLVVTAPGLDALARMRALRRLDLTGSDLRDAGLRRLGLLEGLSELDLDRAILTGADVQQLAQLKHLRSINMANTRVDPATLEEMAKVVPHLEVLHYGGQEAVCSENGVGYTRCGSPR